MYPRINMFKSTAEIREAEEKRKKKEKAHKEFANVISNIFAQIPNKPTQEERV